MTRCANQTMSVLTLQRRPVLVEKTSVSWAQLVDDRVPAIPTIAKAARSPPQVSWALWWGALMQS